MIMRRKILEADKRILKMNTRIDLMMLEIKNNEAAVPSVKKTKAIFNYRELENFNGQKMTFCC